MSTASRLFLQYGLRSVTIDEVCNEVHISKKTFYNYFRQKDELIEMVLLNQCEVLNQKKNKKHAILDDPSLNAIDKLVLAFKHWKQDSSMHSMTFLYDLMKYYPEIHSKMVERQDQMAKEATKKWIQQGIDEGFVRSDVSVDLLATYIQFQFSKVLSELIGKSDIGVAPIIDFLLDSNIRVLVNEKGYRYYQEKYKKEYPALRNVENKKETESNNVFYWSEPPQTNK
ncbi:TetR/AcrR family transcriptional regulator [Microbacter margulisiae]|uniref:AcrR family transcriptional regulator n=1 Tax=Microbacter margulisiae TaxID=1350067 RepID=A0A7W5DU38_9PORP|nr:TetR/AcrR family transcriptional regulator [Microbacter margulisiae]MBB3188248.1 AcrR family transcriptional regulator [Microbacter margulisiae]